jgi:hypothetical protein
VLELLDRTCLAGRRGLEAPGARRTVSGEHGIDLLKRDGMYRELDPGAIAMLGIFNPGKG